MPQRRGPWTDSEDRHLLHLVDIHGGMNWVEISRELVTRSPKQCRERYHQNLKPCLNHDPISAAEGEKIEMLVREHGQKWAMIARCLDGRSDNAVKNWWNGSQNRRKRMAQRKSAHMSRHNHEARSLPRPGLYLADPVPRPASPSSCRRTGYRGESDLPSPVLSECPASETPGHSPTQSAFSPSYPTYLLELRRRPGSSIALPPLRTFEGAEHHGYHSAAGARPQTLSYHEATPRAQDSLTLRPILTSIESHSERSHLPTAPNSPISSQQSHQPPIKATSGRDSRMAWSNILTG